MAIGYTEQKKNGTSLVTIQRHRPTRYRDLWKYGSQPGAGAANRITGYDSALDSPEYVTDSLTFTGLAQLLKSADDGNARDMVRLSQEIESKDPHLRSVANTRRMALTGMDWTIEPATVSDKERQRQAEEAATYVREVLSHPSSMFRRLQKSMAKAIGPNLAVNEIVWDGITPVDLDEVPVNRLNIDYVSGPEIRVFTKDDQAHGRIANLGKFIIHRPEGAGIFPFTSCITRAQALYYLIKHGTIADWATFAEVYGMPVRAAVVDGNATDTQKKGVATALAQLGTDGYAVFSTAVDFKMIEANRGVQPYGEMVTWIENRQAIGFLGQTLTTDIGDVGSRAAAEIHDNVRRDITEDDIENEAETIEEQLFGPMVAFRFPGRGYPVPRFVRTFRERRDATVDLANAITLVRDAGLPVKKAELYARAGMTEPTDKEAGLLTNEGLPKLAVPPGLPGGF